MYDNHKLIKLYEEVGDNDPVVLFAKVRSVSADEVVRAEQLGLKAKYQLTVNRFEYGNQMYAEVDGKMYAVYRIYEADGDKTELYIEDKLGV